MQKSAKVTIGVVVVLLVAILGAGIANALSIAQLGHPIGMMGYGGSSSAVTGQSGYGMMGNQNWSSLDAVSPVATNHVTLTDRDSFSPQVIQVKAGTTVTWRNVDTDAHSVTFMSGMPMSGMMGNSILSSQHAISYTFPSPGSYNYFCMYHQGMIARVIVTA
jgi:plastocyanin